MNGYSYIINALRLLYIVGIIYVSFVIKYTIKTSKKDQRIFGSCIPFTHVSKEDSEMGLVYSSGLVYEVY